MEDFKNLYRNLETKVMIELRMKIENSDYISDYTQTNAIRVNVFDYTELTIIDDRLTFLDEFGQDYDLTEDCSLEDLIDILVDAHI